MTQQKVKLELGQIVSVQAAKGIKVRNDIGGFYADDAAVEVTLTPHIHQLITDGDLVVVIDKQGA